MLIFHRSTLLKLYVLIWDFDRSHDLRSCYLFRQSVPGNCLVTLADHLGLWCPVRPYSLPLSHVKELLTEAWIQSHLLPSTLMFMLNSFLAESATTKQTLPEQSLRRCVLYVVDGILAYVWFQPLRARLIFSCLQATMRQATMGYMFEIVLSWSDLPL